MRTDFKVYKRKIHVYYKKPSGPLRGTPYAYFVLPN